MDAIKNWAFSVCCAAITGSIMNFILPEGNTSKTFKTVLCIFFLCVVVSPLINLNYTFHDFKYEDRTNNDSLINDNMFLDASSEYLEKEILSETEKIILSEGIKAKDIFVKINISENGSIDINKFEIVLYECSNIDVLKEKILKEIGFAPDITFSEAQ